MRFNPMVELEPKEFEACAIIARVKKDGTATHGNVKRTLHALDMMGHRTGGVEQEGDGAGIQTDIPRLLWESWLGQAGLNATVAADPYFTIGHFMVVRQGEEEFHRAAEQIRRVIREHRYEIVYLRCNEVRSHVLGPRAKEAEPHFLQVACIPSGYSKSSDARSLRVSLAIERALPEVHVVSFSKNSVIYKMRGEVSTLSRYYPELRHNDYRSAISLAHGRYSTNTDSVPQRAQMFSTLGHNGEINTISRLRREARLLGFELPQDGSDSQNLDRVVESFMFRYGFSLMETMELLFPPVWSEFQKLTPTLQDFYLFGRRAFGMLAQGPAAIIARQGDEIVFSADALGLRPLWFCETEKEYVATSEKGVVDFATLESDPKPISPGEKMAIRIRRTQANSNLESLYVKAAGTRLYNHEDIQHLAAKQFLHRYKKPVAKTNLRVFARITGGQAPEIAAIDPLPEARFAAFGWQRDDVEILEAQAASGKETIGSTGYDGPLAILAQGLRNLSEYFKERVAVVTNPAIDGVREGSHFSTHTFLGAKPRLQRRNKQQEHDSPAERMTAQILLRLPILTDTGENTAHALMQHVARQFGTISLQELLDMGTTSAIASFDVATDLPHGHFGAPGSRLEKSSLSETSGEAERPVPRPAFVPASGAVVSGPTLHTYPAAAQAQTAFAAQKGARTLTKPSPMTLPHVASVLMTFPKGTPLAQALALIRRQVEEVALRFSSSIIILDDRNAFTRGHEFIVDAALAVAVANNHLEAQIDKKGISLRRRTSLVLCSGMLRNVHDIMIALGLGAEATVPHLMFRRTLTLKGGIAPAKAAENLLKCLESGVEKVMSTMGIHELNGYGKLFASIGFTTELASLFGVKNELGSDTIGKSIADLEQDMRTRLEIKQKEMTRTPVESHLYPKVWKIAGEVAKSKAAFLAFSSQLKKFEQQAPVCLRQTWDLKPNGTPVAAEHVHLGIDGLASPVYISAMSFGSQGEIAYRAYAESAKRMQILCMNGEGGEMHDLIGRYYHTRGQQVASARFGVNARMLNSARYLEIKIGQGAKPGEGGQLPAFKVTPQIAAARHTEPKIDLVSPSNNHDIYSIEDLAQLVEELKTINPDAKVSVKVPAIPYLGLIATGIAKAGADIITISGYDGGTGAARMHALKHVGYPVEIGVRQSHQALLAAGLRHRVEIWADGGMKSVEDVLKMMALGANRVGFGTLAMVAIGCTICRDCHCGTCHVGITAHFPSEAAALAFGLKKYEPRDYDESVDRLCTLFSAMNEELRAQAGALGLADLAGLVGHTEYLEQVRECERVDCNVLLAPLGDDACSKTETKHSVPKRKKLRRPMTSLTRQISASITQEAEQGYREIVYDDNEVTNVDRAIGTHLAGALARKSLADERNEQKLPGELKVTLNIDGNRVPGNGLGAFNGPGINIIVRGGSQDGTAKCARGGVVAILKGENHDGVLVDGSVGKCFAYGAQEGLFIVQGDADSRAGIRLSGADVIIGGMPRKPIDNTAGNLANRANIKGFAFEYMTGGRGLVFGDPGPWMCSGMSGGVVYFRLDPKMGLNLESLQQRLAPGSSVRLQPVDEADEKSISELLSSYAEILQQCHQHVEFQFVINLMKNVKTAFVKGKAGS
ncbi:MAG: glutamate synthase-related protein [bacterium]